MPRYKLTLEYDGTPFVGWQMQENGASVQGRLAEAIKAFSGEDVIPRGAGRTDAGVHALGQVAHFDLAKEWPTDKVRDALNAQLRPDPITVLACETRPTISTRASRPRRATISIASSTAAARSRSSATAPGACSAPSTPRPCTKPRKSSSAITTSPPSARPNARPNRR